MVANGVLWTAAHHRIPILMVMHNNRAYHQEVMGIQGVANRRNRGVDRIHIGTTIDDPNVDYAPIVEALIRAGAIVEPGTLDWWRRQTPLLPSSILHIEAILQLRSAP